MQSKVVATAEMVWHADCGLPTAELLHSPDDDDDDERSKVCSGPGKEPLD